MGPFHIFLAATLSATLAAACPKYNRDVQYGDWIDSDQDCQYTRAEILIRSSQTPVTFRNGKTCTVDSGLWLDPYSGATHRAAAELEIDHFVPVSEAHKSGAWKWTQEKRIAFYNFLDSTYHLIPTASAINQSKHDYDPARWLPPNSSYQKEYARNWIKIKTHWGLTSDAKELTALRNLLPGEDLAYPVDAPEDSCTDVSTGVEASIPRALPPSRPWASGRKFFGGTWFLINGIQTRN